MCGPGGQVTAAFCSQSMPILCPIGTSFGFSAPVRYDHKEPYQTLCFTPKIAAFLSDRWALPDLSGTPILNCMHIWNVLEIRLAICKRLCVTPNALSRSFGHNWRSYSSGTGVFRHPNLWNMPSLGTPCRQSIQALFMTLLGVLSQALGLLETSLGFMTVVCKLVKWIRGEKDLTYCT